MESRSRKDFAHLLGATGLVIVVPEHGHTRNVQRGQLAREHAGFLGVPVIGQVAGEEQQLRRTGDLGEQRLKRACRRLRAVQIPERGDAHGRAVARTIYGCHGGSLAGNDSAIRSSISDSCGSLPCWTDPSRRCRSMRTPANAATPEAASMTMRAILLFLRLERAARRCFRSSSSPAGASASTDRARRWLVRFFTACLLLTPVQVDETGKLASRPSHDCCKCHPKSTG